MHQDVGSRQCCATGLRGRAGGGRESGGPTVVAPTRHGFGSRLIQRSIQVDMNGETMMAFDPEGLRCRIALRLGGD